MSLLTMKKILADARVDVHVVQEFALNSFTIAQRGAHGRGYLESCCFWSGVEPAETDKATKNKLLMTRQGLLMFAYLRKNDAERNKLMRMALST